MFTRSAKCLMLLALTLIFSTTSYAAPKMKPGLWEMTMRSDMMNEAMKGMAKIPPEQLEKMKQMGIQMPAIQNGAITQKMCMTKEMVERDMPPMAQKEQHACKPQNLQQSGSTYSMNLVCDGPEIKGTGMVKGSYNNDGMLHSVYDFKGTAHNRPITQHMETDGKWLSADCGDVKPLGQMMPPAKK